MFGIRNDRPVKLRLTQAEADAVRWAIDPDGYSPSPIPAEELRRTLRRPHAELVRQLRLIWRYGS